MSQQINLFNPVFRKQKNLFSVAAMLQAFGLIVLGSVVFYAYAWYQVDQLSHQTAELTKRFEAEQVRLANFASEFSPRNSSKLLNDELTALEAQAAAQKNLLDTLKSGALGNTKGYSEYLRAFARQTESGLWLTGFDISGDGARMNLQGAATNPQLLPAYIQHMNKEPIMRGKSFSALQMKQPQSADGKAVRSYVEFSLQSTEADGGAK